MHHPIALEAFQAGKDVLIEKPIALTLSRADEMITASELARLRFCVSLNPLFLPADDKLMSNQGYYLIDPLTH